MLFLIVFFLFFLFYFLDFLMRSDQDDTKPVTCLFRCSGPDLKSPTSYIQKLSIFKCFFFFFFWDFDPLWGVIISSSHIGEGGGESCFLKHVARRPIKIPFYVQFKIAITGPGLSYINPILEVICLWYWGYLSLKKYDHLMLQKSFFHIFVFFPPFNRNRSHWDRMKLYKKQK